MLLHPGLLFALAWTAVLGTWALTSEDTFVRLTASEKYVSFSAVAFFLAAVGAFVLGTLLGPAMFRSEGPAGPLGLRTCRLVQSACSRVEPSGSSSSARLPPCT